MLKDSQLDLCGRVDFARTTPLLARDEAFSFACAGCGGCCRAMERYRHNARLLLEAWEKQPVSC